MCSHIESFQFAAFPDFLRDLCTYFSQHHLASSSAQFSTLSSPLLKKHLSRDALIASLDSRMLSTEDCELFKSLIQVRGLFVCLLFVCLFVVCCIISMLTNTNQFCDSILKTNFFKNTKTAISFRLDPSFLRVAEFPDPLFGMFLVVGSEFRAFHLRFQDIARGGIR
jgi:NAD-specific glutamate dehydrogenase